MKIDKNILDGLRKNLPLAFHRSTGMTMILSKDPENPYYYELSENIKFVLELAKKHQRSPGGHTFFKLFFELDSCDYDPQTIFILQKYCITILGKVFRSTAVSLIGADIIDVEFLILIEEKNQHTAEDFYLAKTIDNCQWYGIAKEWDFPHPYIENVQNEIIASYENNFDTIISAVIYGNGGCGKSTFLRRLAVSCISLNIKAIWVNDLDFFILNELETLQESSNKYLVVIEDWTTVVDDELLTRKLFSKIIKSKNVRLIIGDRSISNRKYKKYVYGDNFFELTPDENHNIINHILLIRSEWETAISSFPFEEIYEAPIYLIVFIIAREMETGKKVISKSVFSRFTEILEYDLLQLHSLNHVFAKMFYCCCILYGKHWQTLSWSALINLVKGITLINNQNLLKTFDKKNPICKILSNYIFLENLIIPGYQHKQIIYFHHNLLTEGFCKLRIDKFYFDMNILADMIEHVRSMGDFLLYIDLLMIYRDYSRNKAKELSSGISHIIASNPKFSDLLSTNHILKAIYSQADKQMDEFKWLNRLFTIFLFFWSYGNECVKSILKTLIEKGCTANCIKDAFDKSLMNDKYLLQELKPTMADYYLTKYKGTKQEGDIELMIRNNAFNLDVFQPIYPFKIFNIDKLFEL